MVLRCDCLSSPPQLSLAHLDSSAIVNVINQWRELFEQRGGEDGIEYVQIFEVGTSPSDRRAIPQPIALAEQRRHDGMFKSALTLPGMVSVYSTVDSSD